MNADADLDLVFAQLEGRDAGCGYGAGGESNAHAAGCGIDAGAESDEVWQRHALFGGSAEDFLDHQRSGNPTTPDGVGRVVDRHVVINQNARDLALGHFRGHLEVHHVAFVVLDDQDDTCACVGRLDGGKDTVGSGRGENRAGNRGIEHPPSDKAGMQGFVARSAAGDECDFGLSRRTALHEAAAGVHRDQIRVGGGKTVKAFVEDIGDVVDQLLHEASSSWQAIFPAKSE
jgi:hypothetical protein